MTRLTAVWGLLALAGCPPDDPGTTDTDTTGDPIEVHIAVWCTDAPCTTLTATAVTDAGRPDSWTWTWGDEGETFDGQTVQLPLADGLSLLELDASADGSTAYDSGVVAVTPVDVYADGAPPPSDDTRVVFVPFTDCEDIPVVSIGGCITGGADPIDVAIASVDNHAVHFSQGGFVSGAPDAYTSDQTDPHAVWRVGSPLVEGQAPGTSPSVYYTAAYPAPPDPAAAHFTFYFDGIDGGTAVLLASHGSPDAKVYAQHELAITCDAEGQIDNIAHRPVDRGALDHDGDGYPAARDCDETDPTVHDDVGC